MIKKLNTLADWLGERLPELIAEHRVPGAVIGVYANGEHLERAAGVLNTRTGVPVTTDSLFQIGSVSKVWTATLALQLVEDGKLDLDLPVRAYLPEFRSADESALITTRRLLCHTAGFEETDSPTPVAATTPSPGTSNCSAGHPNSSNRANCSPTTTPDTS